MLYLKLGPLASFSISTLLWARNICKAAYLSRREMGKIHYLDKATTERLVHAFISSRLGCCNSLLYGLPSLQLDKLQRVQNTATRLVTRSTRHEYITPILHDLHWLPVSKRIAFKIMLFIYKAQNGLAPAYISQLLDSYHSHRTLRSSTQNLLHILRTRTVHYTETGLSQ